MLTINIRAMKSTLGRLQQAKYMQITTPTDVAECP